MSDCEDQACGPTEVCIKFQCQRWEGGTRIQPKLELRGKYWCCPCCGDSYGEHAKGVAKEPTMTKLDAKFEGTIRKAKDGSLVPDDEWCVFLAKDSIFALLALPTYLQGCINMKCDQAQIDAVTRMLDRVVAWRLEHPDCCKYPDAWGERLLDQP